MQFIAPETGQHNLTLIFVCDSYLGCDEYIEMKMTILDNEDETEEEEEEVIEDKIEEEITLQKNVE